MTSLDRILGLINNRFPSDAAFERAFGVTAKTVSSWKRPNSQTHLRRVVDLASFFDVSVAYLLCETDDPSVDLKKPLPSIEEGAYMIARALLDSGKVKSDSRLSDALIAAIVEYVVKNSDFILARAEQIEKGE